MTPPLTRPHHPRRSARDRSTPPAQLPPPIEWGRRFAATVANATTPLDQNLYAGVDEAARLWPRNPACYAAAIDTTCISPYNSAFGHYAAGTLITPCDAIMATHFSVTEPKQFWFARPDGTSIALDWESFYAFPTGDTTIIRFAQDAPPEIKPARLIHPRHLPDALSQLPGALILHTNAARQPGDAFPPSPAGNYHASKQAKLLQYFPGPIPAVPFNELLPDWQPAAEFGFTIIPGDSGNPSLLDIADGGPPALVNFGYGPDYLGLTSFAANLGTVLRTMPNYRGHQPTWI